MLHAHSARCLFFAILYRSTKSTPDPHTVALMLPVHARHTWTVDVQTPEFKVQRSVAEFPLAAVKGDEISDKTTPSHSQKLELLLLRKTQRGELQGRRDTVSYGYLL